MCAIAGYVDYRAGADASAVKKMTTALAHRGPDGEGHWSDKQAALGHRRLKIIDLSDHGAQPMISSCRRYVLVFNGEIYNYKDLHDQLDDGTPWQSTSDSEVLLRAFRKWGPDCLSRLNGMFAFAIWDTAEKSLFMARDRFGIKPLYFYQKEKRLIFASEIKGILAAGVEPVSNPEKIGEFLRWGALDYSTETWFRGIHSLLPGHYAIWRENGLQTQRYWWLPDHVDESHPVGLDETAEEFTALLNDSLRLQLQSDRPVGSHLSGGVDSTIVTALTAARQPGQLASYTFGYEEKLYDERPFAEPVAQNLGISNEASVLTTADIEAWLPRALREEDEPFTSLRQLSHHKLYADFARQGSTVILEASGGDEIGGGYSSYLWAVFLDNVQRLSAAEASQELVRMANTIGMLDQQMLRFILGSAANYQLPGISTSDGIPSTEPQILDRDFETRYGRRAPEYPRPFRSHLRNFQYLDLMYAKLPRGLRYIDRASMASGREARLPLLDHRLVQLGFSASNDAKIGDGHLRRFMKQAIRNALPPELIHPNKRSVADPQKAWLRGPLKDWVGDVFSSTRFAQRGIFNPVEMKKVFDRFCQGDASLNSLGVFQPFIVEMWFRCVLEDRHQPAVPAYLS